MKRSVGFAAAALFLLAWAFAIPGAAQACKLARLAELPVRLSGNAPIARATVNGHKTDVLLSTSVPLSYIHVGTARKLGLEIKSAPGFVARKGARKAEASSAVVGEMRLGEDVVRNWTMLVAGSEHPEAGIVLGADFFAKLDVEFDLRNRVVRLFQARDCAGRSLAYWAPAGAVEVPITSREGDFFDVFVNGRRVEAMIDSGGEGSVLSSRIAKELGASGDSPVAIRDGCVHLGGHHQVDDPSIVPFESFAIGDQVVRNPRLRIGEIWKYGDFPGLLSSKFQKEEFSGMFLGGLPAHPPSAAGA